MLRYYGDEDVNVTSSIIEIIGYILTCHLVSAPLRMQEVSCPHSIFLLSVICAQTT